MLSRLKLRHFRCFDSLECEFGEGSSVIVGANAQGKTSLLEAACVLLRLQSPRVSTLGRAIKHHAPGFVLDGHFKSYHLQFYFGQRRKKLALDSVEQKSARDYLQVGHVVCFSNRDIEIVRGPADNRRKFLDFLGAQMEPNYRRHLRVYEKALRSRNMLLKNPWTKSREIAAFDPLLIEAGNALTVLRAQLIEELVPIARTAQHAISGSSEKLDAKYISGSAADFGAALRDSRTEDLRLRQTNVGPHRDDVHFFLNEQSADYCSEGQQRTIALGLRLGQAHLIQEHYGEPSLLLIDDIFGELDPDRRNALLAHLPQKSQRIITTTHVDWMDGRGDVRTYRLVNRTLREDG